jgi:rhamnogalacturonyl hydrolase YesR
MKSSNNLKNEIWSSVLRLDNWIERNKWAGYDPYDLGDTSLFLERKPSPSKKLEKGFFSKLERINPLLVRKLLKIDKKINSKAMGLFAEGYLNLYMRTGEKKYLSKSKECLFWLERYCSRGYSGYCWGYPFDWQSKIFIPKNTPSAVVSSVCGDAFWKHYQYTKEKKYINICKGICEFFLKDLNIHKLSPDKICFSYTPLDDFHVHNANLFAAEFLIKVGQEIGEQKFIDYGLRAANYTLGDQNKDGSICYWGKDQEKKCIVDHYHSGFEIRSLYSIWKLTGDEKIYTAVSALYRFYLDNLFENRTIPRITSKATYPIDIHSCAEAILCNSLLQDDFSQSREYLENSIRWTVNNMQTNEGYFIYRVLKIKGMKRKVRIPYIRWGQAWMLNALSKCLSKEYT